ncbi:hypothetical protein [Maribellus mangrovi]|uniref:hypothetical protein n=1 Tax=Maribellus mangrovi TaxID=3133146 RepID=UPI0030EBC8BF
MKDYEYLDKGLSDKGLKEYYGWILILVAAIIGSVLYANKMFTLVDVNEDLAKLSGDIFLKYIFIVVAVERAAAVFVGMLRSQNKTDWSVRIRRINEILQKDDPSIELLKQVYARERRLTSKLEEKEVIGKIDDVPKNGGIQDYVGFLTSVKYAYEFQRARYDSVSSKYVARTVFFVGIVLATFGISLFQDLLQNMNLVSAMDEELKKNMLLENGLAWQSGLLRFADILVTGGLLGGGSAALNSIANKVSEFLNKQ